MPTVPAPLQAATALWGTRFTSFQWSTYFSDTHSPASLSLPHQLLPTGLPSTATSDIAPSLGPLLLLLVLLVVRPWGQSTVRRVVRTPLFFFPALGPNTGPMVEALLTPGVHHQAFVSTLHPTTASSGRGEPLLSSLLFYSVSP